MIESETYHVTVEGVGGRTVDVRVERLPKNRSRFYPHNGIASAVETVSDEVLVRAGAADYTCMCTVCRQCWFPGCTVAAGTCLWRCEEHKNHILSLMRSGEIITCEEAYAMTPPPQDNPHGCAIGDCRNPECIRCTLCGTRYSEGRGKCLHKRVEGKSFCQEHEREFEEEVRAA